MSPKKLGYCLKDEIFLSASIIDQELAVDNWNAVHDKHGKFSEEHNGKIIIEEAKEYKYLVHHM